MKWLEELLQGVEILEYIKSQILKMAGSISVKLARLSKSVGVPMLSEGLEQNRLLIINFMPPCGKKA
jgi:hypothetical protein